MTIRTWPERSPSSGRGSTFDAYVLRLVQKGTPRPQLEEVLVALEAKLQRADLSEKARGIAAKECDTLRGMLGKDV